MRALVTGGAGFIGSNLVRRLLDDGWDVTVIDNLSTGSLANVPIAALPIYQLGIAELEEGYRGTLSGLCEKADVIFHLAAHVGVLHVLRVNRLTIERNVEATAIMLRHAKEAQTPILIASSSEVYGRRQDDRPLTEDMDLHIGPELRWAYAAGKLADEFLARTHHEESGLPVVVARLFNTIGPHQVGTYGMVVPRMMDAVLSNEPIQVIGGIQRRSFAWVTEVVDALIRLIQNPDAYGQVVNVGSCHDIRISTLAILIQREFNLHGFPLAAIDYKPYRSDYQEIMYRMPDLTKLRALTGTVPGIPIEMMIQDLVAYRMRQFDSPHTIKG